MLQSMGVSDSWTGFMTEQQHIIYYYVQGLKQTLYKKERSHIKTEELRYLNIKNN